MPQSIVIAIDDPYRERLEEVAGEIKAVTGRKDLAAATRPHVTLHVAGSYADGIEATLAHISTRAAGLTLHTREVGVFRGPQTVVALEVVRTDELIAFHRTLLGGIAPLANEPKPAYATDLWAPHVSIVAGRLEPQHADAIMPLLARRDFAWPIPVTNICLVPDQRHPEWMRFDVAL